jgi:hypothetical protein
MKWSLSVLTVLSSVVGTSAECAAADKRWTDWDDFYERVMSGEKIPTRWIEPTDIQPGAPFST